MNGTIGIGVIGLGVMGQRMLARLAEHPGARARVAWDPDAAAMAATRARYPELLLAADVDALVATRGLDCVYIASPPGAHLDHAGRGFDRGLAVFSEKPLTTDFAAARRTIARIERERLRNAVNFSLASSPGLAAIQAALADGSIGAPQLLEIVVSFKEWPRAWQAAAGRWLAERQEGGFTREVLSHFVFVAQRALGPARIETSRAEYPPDGVGAERALTARLAAGGIPVTIDGRVAGEHPDFNRLTLRGSAGAVELHDWFGVRRRSGEGPWRAEGTPESNRAHGQARQLDQLVAMVEGRAHTLPSFAEALDVQRTIEALLRG
jgi:predicted dehydrogenase